MKIGFTLIELLVVVLIIGILAAVALPQYEKSVEKSRAVQAIVLVRAVKDAAEVYRMANGAYPNDLSSLDIEVSTNLKDFVWEENMFKDGRFALKRNKPEINYYIVYSGDIRQQSDWDTSDVTGKLYCSSSTPKGIEVCRSVGKTRLTGRTDFEFWGV